MAQTFTDQEDTFTVIDPLDPLQVSDATEVVTVSDGDLLVNVSEVSDALTIVDASQGDAVNVSDTADEINIAFSEVIQPITTNVTNDNSVFTGIAAEDLGGHRIVVAFGSQIAYADNTIAAHASIVTGITTSAVLAGNSVNVTISGEVIEGSWNWTLNTPIFLTATGLMTQTVPPTGFLLQVGYPTSITSMVVDIKTPIVLST